MIINAFSWHARWFNYWLTHGRGVRLGYQENLCHYVRVLLFWAPLAWIGEHTPTSLLKRIATAVMVAYMGAVVLALIAVLVYWAITAPVVLAIVAGSTIGGLVILVAVLVLATVVVGDRRLEIPGTAKLAVAYIMAKKHHICPFITFE